MKKDEFIKHIPNILTMSNMLYGLASILALILLEHRYKVFISAGLILLGVITDGFDGFTARRLNASSAMGKQLDSFADLITFGIAPVVLVNYLALSQHMIVVGIVSFLFPMAGAYRLARYNLNDFTNHFMGLPITAAGMLLSLFCAAYLVWAPQNHPQVYVYVTIAFILVLSVLMVSKKKINRLSLLRRKL